MYVQHYAIRHFASWFFKNIKAHAILIFSSVGNHLPLFILPLETQDSHPQIHTLKACQLHRSDYKARCFRDRIVASCAEIVSGGISTCAKTPWVTLKIQSWIGLCYVAAKAAAADISAAVWNSCTEIVLYPIKVHVYSKHLGCTASVQEESHLLMQQ